MENIEYKVNHSINLSALLELYQSVGWTAYTKNKEKMGKILPASLWYMAAYIGSDLVGLVRTVGDGVSIIYVQDLLVKPDYQRSGIGRNLMTAVMKNFYHVRQIVLVTNDEEKTQKFYEAVGMNRIEETEGVCFIRYID